MKVKFRNVEADEKYTHKGCVAISEANFQSIDNVISAQEQYIANSGVDKVDVDIDCSSKYIKLAGLVLLAFLL